MNSNPIPHLAGLTVMVTRPAHQSAALADPLRDLGATVVIEPSIEILPPQDWANLDRAVQNIAEGRISTLVFVSVNGVSVFLDRATQSAQAVNLDGVRVIGIGKATCQALADRKIAAQAMPDKSDSNAVADFLIERPTAGGTLIVRADRGSKVLPDRLKAAKIDFQQIVAYRSVDRETVADSSLRAMEAGEIDWVTVTSSAIAGALVRLFGDALNQTKLVSISPLTSQALRDLGHNADAEASQYDMAGIIEAMVANENRD